MRLTETVNDVVAQAASLLSPPDMSDWTPPADAPPDVQWLAEVAEYDRRMQAKIDRYLADRSDRLLALRALREQAYARAQHYEAQASPWERMADRQRRVGDYCEQLARNVLVTERAQAGVAIGEPYRVTLPNGQRLGLRITKVVTVTDADALPENCVRVTVTRAPDKTAIRKLLDAGQDVPGAIVGKNEHVDWGRS